MILLIFYVICCFIYLATLQIIYNNNKDKLQQIQKNHDENLLATYHKYLVDIDLRIAKLKQNSVFLKEEHTSRGQSLITKLKAKQKFYESIINSLLKRLE